MSGLGSTWDEEEHRERFRADTRPPREVFHLHAAKYAAKVAAETIRAEPPRAADLSDDALIEQLALCGQPPRPSEVSLVREAFLAECADGRLPSDHFNDVLDRLYDLADADRTWIA